ncbi:MAG: hypothetical protein DRP09_10500 [Candidatus Thorarchaeota archaeon]|nr:MAG: hypothetical protein DRP09_10500 [Candidatus Thorarchaeota archaeon]
MTKTKKPIEFEIEARKMNDLISLVKNFSDMTGATSWDFLKDGLIIHAGDSDYVSLLLVSMNKNQFESYKISEDRIELQITIEELEEIKTICKAAKDSKSDTETLIKFTLSEQRDKFTTRYNNITRRPKLSSDHSTRENTNYKTATKVYPKSETIGELEIVDLKLFMRASATWSGESDRVTRITKLENSMEMKTEIEHGRDEVVLDLSKIEKKFKGKKLSMMLQSKKLNMLIKNATRFTEKITLRGATDFPLIIMAKDRDPAKADKFQEDFNFWYLLAPRIESE